MGVVVTVTCDYKSCDDTETVPVGMGGTFVTITMVGQEFNEGEPIQKILCAFHAEAIKHSNFKEEA